MSNDTHLNAFGDNHSRSPAPRHLKKLGYTTNAITPRTRRARKESAAGTTPVLHTGARVPFMMTCPVETNAARTAESFILLAPSDRVQQRLENIEQLQHNHSSGWSKSGNGGENKKDHRHHMGRPSLPRRSARCNVKCQMASRDQIDVRGNRLDSRSEKGSESAVRAKR